MMTSSIAARTSPASGKTMGTRPPRNQLLLLGLIFIIGTNPSDAIGRWGKESTSNETEHVKDSRSDMEKTYLDLFGESAKEFLTQKAPEKLKTVFPATDEECVWDWRYRRCEPYCECSFQPKLPGDFLLGRACRKRSHFHDSEEESTRLGIPFDGTSEMYRDYCLIQENGKFVGYQTSSLKPPPPSIPSPFPFLTKSGRATWKILRTRADPVVERAAQEIEVLHGKIQSVVCQDVKHRCEDGDGLDATHSQFAWQERLFCGDVVNECSSRPPLPIAEGNDGK